MAYSGIQRAIMGAAGGFHAYLRGKLKALEYKQDVMQQKAKEFAAERDFRLKEDRFLNDIEAQADAAKAAAERFIIDEKKAADLEQYREDTLALREREVVVKETTATTAATKAEIAATKGDELSLKDKYALRLQFLEGQRKAILDVGNDGSYTVIDKDPSTGLPYQEPRKVLTPKAQQELDGISVELNTLLDELRGVQAPEPRRPHSVGMTIGSE